VTASLGEGAADGGLSGGQGRIDYFKTATFKHEEIEQIKFGES
jgi:hypothetical protein